ncbi:MULTISPECIES: peptide ABC transporter substrate-binding protein [Brevibacillus]|uniref:peptide ABC transporter substrate-binding protein n=1 Tax=Brevibacillus TaxID=55080 RepID=UPI00156ACEC9|nr:MULTISPECIES: peptide ABC transporter substrate-binding protein [Brevibacillus]MBU8712370.1 peptide ABC transporter substrate-binding protein [Brevibacillus parabrevis]MDH6349441.1 oligopeptide transport system substrate-binding protein [Brevibacillus sp. 1238]NRQ52467.1 peptide ABC transporter substrate-binding protein [Brevibacillus sp. HD1.4A]UED71661.1 peptide ABC transporter substrate-binding protein [Brevibacillus sp. HD3.3A]
MKKLAAFALSVSLVVPALAGCGGSSGTATNNPGTASSTPAAAVKQEVVFNAKSEPPDLNPLTSTDTTSFWIMDHLGEGLYTKDKEGNPVLGVAKEVKLSDDKLKYTFTLRDDAKWTNGEPVTAEDFAYTFMKHIDPATASTTAYLLYYIKGAEAYNKGTGKAEDVGIKALDAKTLEIELVAPTSYFDKMLATRYWHPINKKQAEADPKWAANAETYISNGAYKLVSWKHDSELVIEKNENYWNKDDVKMEKITWKMVNDATTSYQMYKSGELDFNKEMPSDILAQEKSSPDYKSVPYYGTYMYMFNVTKEPFTNKKVRRAFAMAIDRKALTEMVSQGGETPAYSMVPRGAITPTGKDFREEGGDYFKEDPAEAKKLLAEGMQEAGWSTLPEVTLMYNTDESHKKIAQALQEMLKKNLGVDVKLTNQEWKVYLDTTRQKNYQMGRMGWVGQISDPAFNLDYYLGDSPNNRTGWVNKEYDDLNMAAKVEQDPNKRMELLHKAEAVLMEEMPFIPIYHYQQNYLVKPGLEGLTYPVNAFPSARWATKK